MNATRVLVLLIVTAALATGAANGAPARDTLVGFNGIAFGAEFAAVKKQLGADTRVEIDPTDPNGKVLIVDTKAYGETFAVNYLFDMEGRFTEAYAIGKLPTGDFTVCLSRWNDVARKLRDKFGTPDGDANRLAAKVQSESLIFKFADGSAIEASILGCLVQLSFLSPTALQ